MGSATARGIVETATRPDRLIGRGRDLAVLVEHLDALWRSPAETPPGVRAGGSVLMLVGEAGIGKTSVALEFAEIGIGRGATVLWGTCVQREAGPPHGPWNEIVASLLQLTPPKLLREHLGPGAPALARAFPDLRRVLPDIPPATPLEPGDERLRFWEAVSRWLQRDAERAPVVVILDELDAGDLDTIRLLRHVIRTTATSPVLILGIHREPQTKRGAGGPLAELMVRLRVERPYRRHRLAGLGLDDVGALLGERTRVRAGAAGVRAITRRTGGNPFYVEIARRSLVDAWAAADLPVGREVETPRDPTSEGVRSAGSGGSDADSGAAADDLEPGTASLRLPRRREELLERRIARRSPDAATVLRILAAFPGPAGRDLLGPVTELAPERILDGLDETVRAGLVAVEGTGAAPAWRVAHPIVREAFEGRWTVARRAHLHRRVAQAMERSVAGRERESAAALGWHYHASAAIPGADRGLRYLLLAAEAARGVYAHVRAATLLRMALAVTRKDDAATRADVSTRLAQAEADAMLPLARQAAEAAASAMAEARLPGEEIAGSLADVARSLRRGGAPPEAWRPIADRAVTLLRGDRGRQWARMTALTDPVVTLLDGPAIRAGRWQGRDPAALRILRSSTVEDDRADALHPLDRRTVAETSAVLAEARGWRRPAASMHAIGVALRDLVDRHAAYAEAAGVATDLVELARHHGALRIEAAALMDLALCELVLGAGEAAGRTMRAAERRSAALDLAGAITMRMLEVALARAAYEDRDWHRLDRIVAGRVADPSSVLDPWILPLTAWSALAAIRRSRPDVARDRVPPVVELLARTGAEMPGHPAAVVVAAEAAWELGAGDHATTLRTLAEELVEREVGPHPVGSARHAVARMAALLGHGTEASAILVGEQRAYEQAGLRPLAAMAIHDRAVALVSTGAGEPAAADALLRDAAKRFSGLGMPGRAARAELLRAELAGAPGSAAPTLHQTFPDGLTAREIEVLRMIARGSRAAEIGERLFLDPGVVERHVENVRAKTGLDDAAALREYALRHGLVARGTG